MTTGVKVHELKCNTQFFDDLVSRGKCFEVRRDDRGFQRGDILEIRRFGRTRYGWHYMRGADDPAGVEKEQADVYRTAVTYILTGGQFGIEPGFVVMGLEPVA